MDPSRVVREAREVDAERLASAIIRLAAAGLGWEDLVVRLGLTETQAKAIVFGYQYIK